MMKIVFVVMFVLPAFSQTLSVRPQVNPLEELARQILALKAAGKEDPKLLQEFTEIAFKKVVEEIEAEAAEAGSNKDKYIEDGKSMDKFLTDLRAQTTDLNNISNAKALVLTSKAMMRLRIQESIRFIPDGHFEKVSEVREINENILVKLKIFINKHEENLNTAVEFLKKNPQVMRQMIIESSLKDCNQSARLNTYLYSLLFILRNGTTIEIGDQTIRISGDLKWGFLRKDSPGGGQTIDPDTIAYETEDGVQKVYDVIESACSLSARVPSQNFKIFHLDKESKKRNHWSADGIQSRATPPGRGQR